MAIHYSTSGKARYERFFQSEAKGKSMVPPAEGTGRESRCYILLCHRGACYARSPEKKTWTPAWCCSYVGTCRGRQWMNVERIKEVWSDSRRGVKHDFVKTNVPLLKLLMCWRPVLNFNPWHLLSNASMGLGRRTVSGAWTSSVLTVKSPFNFTLRHEVRRSFSSTVSEPRTFTPAHAAVSFLARSHLTLVRCLGPSTTYSRLQKQINFVTPTPSTSF